VTGWESWAPPLSPPAEAGLSVEEAEGIAAAWWECEPHLAAALMWESYAATLPPELPVSMVTTGSQSVAYGQSIPGRMLGGAEPGAVASRVRERRVGAAGARCLSPSPPGRRGCSGGPS
jgi:hypothetical protein